MTDAPGLLPAENKTPQHNVVLCVHNGLEDVRECLNSLLETWESEALAKLIIVDDASRQDTADPVAQFVRRHDFASLVRLDTQHYYTRAANVGLKLSVGEIHTLLNSDTIVTPNWARNIRAIFNRDPNVGIVGPMSNAASTQSLPHVKSHDGQTAINHLPPMMSPARFSKAIATLAAGLHIPYVPVIHGFCYTIHQKVIDQIGYLDAEHFPNGYGEENDYSFRAEDAGFALAIALNSFVFHAKSRSYKPDEQQEFTKAGHKALAEKFSNRRIQNAIATMENQPVLVELRKRVQEFWPEHDFLSAMNEMNDRQSEGNISELEART